MIDLTRRGAQGNDRYLPAVMTQGNASTYDTMIDSSGMRPRSQMDAQNTGSAPMTPTQGGGTSGALSAPARRMPAVSNGTAQGEPPEVWMGTQRISPGLGPLPSGPEGMSASEQILHSSWKSLMARNVGRSVIVSFLIGTQNTIVTHGILYEVGNDYIALYQPDEQSYISADLYSVRFMEFLPEVTQTNSQQQQ